MEIFKGTFTGKDLGIVIGVLENVMNHGIIVYKPINDFYPDCNTSEDELTKNLASYQDFTLIPYEATRLIYVDDECIFKNRDSFDRIFQGIKPQVSEFFGRGDLRILLNMDKLPVFDFINITGFKGLTYEVEKSAFESEVRKYIRRQVLGQKYSLSN